MWKIRIKELILKQIAVKSEPFKEIVEFINNDKKVGYYIPSKYEFFFKNIIEKLEKEEKIKKLNILKNYQDLDFLEVGIDDGIK
jgi:2-hydroxy-3-keto-5-methylthiopentenyl-1-phosphate phosphatase